MTTTIGVIHKNGASLPDDAMRPTTFREAMAHLPAPVAVVTAMDGGRPAGTTVSAVMSLSMSPELLVVGLSRDSSSMRVIERERRFGVNVLMASQSELARQFAGKGEAKFRGIPWTQNAGLPRIDGASLWFACSVHSIVEGGDHLLVVGAVELVEYAPGTSPLTYHARRFGTHVSS